MPDDRFEDVDNALNRAPTLLFLYEDFHGLDDVVGIDASLLEQLVGCAGAGHGLNGQFHDFGNSSFRTELDGCHLGSGSGGAQGGQHLRVHR